MFEGVAGMAGEALEPGGSGEAALNLKYVSRLLPRPRLMSENVLNAPY